MDNMKTTEFWQRLDSAVKARYKTYVAFCRDCGFNLATMYNNKNRDRFLPIEYLPKVSEKLNISIDWLLTGKNRESDWDVKELETVKAYLNAPKSLRDIVDKILKGVKE